AHPLPRQRQADNDHDDPTGAVGHHPSVDACTLGHDHAEHDRAAGHDDTDRGRAAGPDHLQGIDLNHNASAADRATKVHWATLIFLLLTLAAALGLHGYVSGAVVGAGTVAPPGPAGEVPQDIQQGGPVIGIHSGPLRSTSLPRHTVILSFDDGPDPPWTPQVLEILKQNRVPGTFFLIGDQMLRYPELVRREIAEGNDVGNHSFSHPDPTLTSVQER